MFQLFLQMFGHMFVTIIGLVGSRNVRRYEQNGGGTCSTLNLPIFYWVFNIEHVSINTWTWRGHQHSFGTRMRCTRWTSMAKRIDRIAWTHARSRWWSHWLHYSVQFGWFRFSCCVSIYEYNRHVIKYMYTVIITRKFRMVFSLQFFFLVLNKWCLIRQSMLGSMCRTCVARIHYWWG